MLRELERERERRIAPGPLGEFPGLGQEEEWGWGQPKKVFVDQSSLALGFLSPNPLAVTVGSI